MSTNSQSFKQLISKVVSSVKSRTGVGMSKILNYIREDAFARNRIDELVNDFEALIKENQTNSELELENFILENKKFLELIEFVVNELNKQGFKVYSSEIKETSINYDMEEKEGNKKIAIIELGCLTSFGIATPEFKNLHKELINYLLKNDLDLDSLKSLFKQNIDLVSRLIEQQVDIIRIVKFEAKEIGIYLHHDLKKICAVGISDIDDQSKQNVDLICLNAVSYINLDYVINDIENLKVLPNVFNKKVKISDLLDKVNVTDFVCWSGIKG